ncbi:ribosomal-protein-alanine N-acetyltransferase [Paenibacillus methanolicus]|uniref:Ribosomal-protein-alanine N-acetyltransferase n=1 Tax=Paenibacillus methanolicus TaxID=582686 RepID=A0A5S5CJ51_9BACL|nr:ribosomal-protein-alanine N-acetyltransferase [Paenibacillus methanolicus]
MDLNLFFTKPPVLETERLFLRKLELEDAPAYFRFAHDPAVSAATLWEPHGTIEDTVKELRDVMHKFDSRQAIRRGIFLQATGDLIGRTGLIRVDPVHDNAHLGYAIASEHWNRGYVTEAAKEVLRFSFLEAGLHRMEARCNSNNAASYRVLDAIHSVILSREFLLRNGSDNPTAASISSPPPPLANGYRIGKNRLGHTCKIPDR